jgi:hypothetical protein
VRFVVLFWRKHPGARPGRWIGSFQSADSAWNAVFQRQPLTGLCYAVMPESWSEIEVGVVEGVGA